MYGKKKIAGARMELIQFCNATQVSMCAQELYWENKAKMNSATINCNIYTCSSRSKIYSYTFECCLCAYPTPQALQVVLVVQALRVHLFLEHLVSQPVQAVPGVLPHLILKKKTILYLYKKWWRGLNQPSFISCNTFYSLKAWWSCLTLRSGNTR